MDTPLYLLVSAIRLLFWHSGGFLQEGPILKCAEPILLHYWCKTRTMDIITCRWPLENRLRDIAELIDQGAQHLLGKHRQLVPGQQGAQPTDRRFGLPRVNFCPRGKIIETPGLVTNDEALAYRASKFNCLNCPLRQKCTPKQPARKIRRDVHEAARNRVRRLATTPAFVQSRDERNKVEMRFAHLKNHHYFFDGIDYALPIKPCVMVRAETVPAHPRHGSASCISVRLRRFSIFFCEYCNRTPKLGVKGLRPQAIHHETNGSRREA